MKTLYHLPVRFYGLLLLMGAMALALSTTATGRTPLTEPLALIQPTYNCATGAITFNTTGGDGSTITYAAPGIVRSSLTSNTGTIEQGLRNDPKPITIQATQSGQTVGYTFDFGAFCRIRPTALPPVLVHPIANQTLTVGQPVGVRSIDVGNAFLDPTVIEGSYMSNWQFQVNNIPNGLTTGANDRDLSSASPRLYLTGTPTTTGVYTLSVTARTVPFPDQPVGTTFTITVLPAPIITGALTLLAPTYNCATGAITFNTTGGDGSPVTYSAPGITGPTTNPNQFVDAGLRQAADAQPLTLSATQSGVTVTYTFDLRATCPVGTNPPAQTNNDRAILVDLYNSTNGSNWTNKTNWLQGNSPCNWFGIKCNNDGRVTEIRINNNNLTGTLPSSLGDLSQLITLDLYYNRLTGAIPATLGNLSRLTYLNLSYNVVGIFSGFSKSIPASLGNLTELNTLNLGGNNLSGSIPSELGNLSKLISLYANSNQLSGPIPASLGNLSQVQYISFAANNLTGSIPASLGTLTQLKTLDLTNNHLGGCFAPELTSLCGKDVKLEGNSPGFGTTFPYLATFKSFCESGYGACTTTPTKGLALIAPTYNCTTGAITFNTTGGDGSPITYQAPGITGPTTNPNQFVDAGLRQAADAQPLTLSATQSGVTVTYTFDLRATCPVGTVPELPSPIASNVEDQVVRLGQTLTYPAIEISSNKYNPAISDDYKAWAINAQGLPPGLSLSTGVLMKTFFLVSINGTANRVGIYPVTVTATNTRAPQNPPFISKFNITVVGSPTGTGLTLTAPTYNCATGAITFNTNGGNGTLIEYQAPGITSWTTNPNQFVDRDSRTANDVKPFTLMARQSGNVVTYTWDLKQACGRARIATEKAGTTLSLHLLGNPVHESVQVLIEGAEGQPVQLRLTDSRGRLLESRGIEQAGAEEVQQFKLDPSVGSGMLFLQATQQQQVKTVKILHQ